MGTVTRAAPQLRRQGIELSHLRDLIVHLAKREVTSLHRFTLLGWMWPLARQLAQLTVLVLVFSKVLDLDIENYAVFVFSGLISWSWFASGVGNGTSSLIRQRHLVFQPRLPTIVLPVVAVAVPLVDVLLALPVLVAMLVWTREVHWTILALPALLAVQLVMMCGLVWFTSAANVYLRDVGNVVSVGLLMLFYLTPVFYDSGRVPSDYAWLLQLNPLTTLIEGYRAVLLEGTLPAPVGLAVVTAISCVLAALGAIFFRRASPGFVDEL